MPAAIDFYFDFSSPYAYFASSRIEALAARHGRAARWRPMLLGAALKIMGTPPMPMIPLKGDYARRDIERSARFYGIEFRMPSVFPIATHAPLRAFYWLDGRDPAAAKMLANALLHAYFVEDRDISAAAVTIDVVQALGHSAAQVEAALNDQALKDHVRGEVDAAIARGVFGSPYIVIDDEPFWGTDRLDQAERWLVSGGF